MSDFPSERITTYQAIPVEVSATTSAPGALVRTPMVLLSSEDFAEIEQLLYDLCNQAALWSAGIVGVTDGGQGFTVEEAPQVVAEAEQLWLRARERIAE